MATGIVLLEKAAGPFPPIVAAARFLPKALALKLDRIRVETLGGAVVAEFPLAKVEQFVRAHGILLQPIDAIRRDRGDYEIRTPTFAVGATRGDPDLGVTEPLGSVAAQETD